MAWRDLEAQIRFLEARFCSNSLANMLCMALESKAVMCGLWATRSLGDTQVACDRILRPGPGPEHQSCGRQAGRQASGDLGHVVYAHAPIERCGRCLSAHNGGIAWPGIECSTATCGGRGGGGGTPPGAGPAARPKVRVAKVMLLGVSPLLSHWQLGQIGQM